MEKYENDHEIPVDMRGVYRVAVIFLVSCVTCVKPFDLNILGLLCDTYYTPSTIKYSIDNVMWSLLPNKIRTDRVIHILMKHEYTTCCLVNTSIDDVDVLLVRKRTKKVNVTDYGEMKQKHYLPNDDSVREILASVELSELTNDSHVVKMIGGDIHTTYVDLYYEYIPYSLHHFCGQEHTHNIPILLDIALGIQSLHSVLLSHRDVKCENIQVDENNRAYLIDTGSVGVGIMRDTVPICTISTRSPEILELEINSETHNYYNGMNIDIWSFGVVCLEVYLGRDPFGHVDGHTTTMDMLDMIKSGLENAIVDLSMYVDPIFVTIVRNCIQFDPWMRPSIDEVVEQLRTLS